MAKKKAAGAGDMDAQIEALEGIVKPKGVKAAREIVDGYDSAVVKLAFKYIRRDERQAGSAGLGKRIDALLKHMPKSEAEETRKRLLRAKAKANA